MRIRMPYRPLVGLALCAAAAMACLQVRRTVPTAPVIPTATDTVAAPVVVPSQAATSTLAATAQPTDTATAQSTSTVAPVSVLKGTVTQKSNCRYGPGAFYLYKIGMLVGAPIEVIGRTIDGGWALAQYAGTHNLCWINSKQIQVNGDLMGLQDYYPQKAPLPRSSKFAGASILSVSGGGAMVTVEWTPVVLPAPAMPGGAGETEYVIELWSCKNGSPGFTTLGTNDTSLSFEVDNSCGTTPHANLVTQTNLGISGIAPITLP
jgi:hypothetical protein